MSTRFWTKIATLDTIFMVFCTVFQNSPVLVYRPSFNFVFLQLEGLRTLCGAGLHTYLIVRDGFR